MMVVRTRTALAVALVCAALLATGFYLWPGESPGSDAEQALERKAEFDERVKVSEPTANERRDIANRARDLQQDLADQDATRKAQATPDSPSQ